MFNETSYSTRFGSEPFNGRPECASADAICIGRFPNADTNDPSVSYEQRQQATEYYLLCMQGEGKASGASGCGGSSTGYANPGSTTYLLDTLTNSQNPDFVFQMPDFLKLPDGSTNWFLLGGVGLLIFAVFMRSR